MKWGKWEVKRTRGGISEKPIWSPRMCLQSSSQSRENILRPYKTQNPDGCNVANCLIFTFLRFSKNVAKSDLHVTHLNKLTFRPKHNALLSSPACICIYWRIHSVPLWWFLCPHSLVLVPFHFTLIQSVFFSFFFTMHWHHCWLNVITLCKNKPELYSLVEHVSLSSALICWRAHITVQCDAPGAKWRNLVGRSAQSARWHADVMRDMLTWLMSDRDDARKNCFTTHHYYVWKRIRATGKANFISDFFFHSSDCFSNFGFGD